MLLHGLQDKKAPFRVFKSDLGTVLQSVQLEGFKALDDGAQLEVHTADAAKNEIPTIKEHLAQKWKLTSRGFMEHETSGLVLAVTQKGKKVVLERKDVAEEEELQKWDVTEGRELKNRGCKLVLTVKGGKKTPGATVWMKKGHSEAHKWSFE